MSQPDPDPFIAAIERLAGAIERLAEAISPSPPPPYEYPAAVLAQDCTYCGAQPGAKCMTASGYPAEPAHAARRRDAGEFDT